MTEKEVLLEINHLKAYFPVKRKSMKEEKKMVKAVDDISIEIYRGETLGIVGESGSGKSTFGRTILKLVEPTAGEVLYKGQPIQHLKGNKLQSYRNQMQMIFQDPFASLNPRMRIGAIIEEPMKLQLTLTKEQRKERVKELLQKVGLPEDAMHKFPHEFSGGQRQRIGIARALAIRPEFIIADEPVSALDVSVQSQVLNLMMDLQDEFQLTYLFISHDLSVVKHISDRVAVLYLGRVVEIGTKKELYAHPLHPYTQALLSAIPVVHFDEPKQEILLQGELPSPINPPVGCVFHTRCPYVMERCQHERPKLQENNANQRVACFLYDE
ncbi:ABC transporter ATP-binding protein [Lysinibacillus sp. RSDA_15]|nr:MULTISPECIES: dipeptide ABC transporter ATP-binding protein [Lysinibacillus]MBI6862267.1 dipeptide ABC transporter ATP-binding protein [Lysinibacillus fusiformis]MDM5350452.1 dipeptide ABC transporter ATP-binding protein [Lysinibacillus sphaericus]MEB7452859.1 dipeptide ABC transporter ATP-binding protein [Lysinibacillus sphaericus]PIJ97134.1 peptide ABC transporter substrate-binding protein [Lysinibacillus sphaericus]QIC49324.1 dipeptide ABC transporter ATP-binding protein [Lysinibacillus 